MENPAARVRAELSQGSDLRRPLLKKIGALCENRYVAALYTSFKPPYGTITETDADLLADILSSTANVKQHGLLLLINSPGGSPMAAERIIKICRECSDGNFAVLVPGQAKSAATLIAFGALKIYLAPTSELGPIDVQIEWVDGSLTPAYAILEAYDELLKRGLSLNKDLHIEPVLQQLQNFDAARIRELRDLRALGEDIAVKVLKSGMLQGHTEVVIRKLVEPFTDPDRHKTHGRPLYLSDIAEHDKKGLFKVESVPLDGELWRNVSEFHMRMRGYMAPQGQPQYIKVFESLESSLVVGA